MAAFWEKMGTIVKNFVQKDFDEMFPKWNGDVDDPAADNIIKVMFNDPGWEWTMECWPVTGTRKVVKMEVIPVKNEVSPVKSESVVKEESSRPRKKARKGSSVSAEKPAAGSEGQQIEKTLKDISDAINLGFGTCLKELKLLADRIEAVEKKVGITNRGGSSDDRQLTTTSNPPKPVDEPGVGGGYDPFAPIDKMKSKELTAWVQKDPSYKLPLKKKPRRCRSRFYQVLRTPLEWLTDHVSLLLFSYSYISRLVVIWYFSDLYKSSVSRL
ncbi:hypothetical protein YC2023_071295 [Brassica napus]